jgi:ATP-dependent Lhr-like helicase
VFRSRSQAARLRISEIFATSVFSRPVGALFFDERVEGCHMLRTQVEESLTELVALGLVVSDSFGGLRALLVPSAQRRPVRAAKWRGRVLSFGMESAGRWSLIPRIDERDTAAAVEHVARTLLRLYGVLF